MSELPERRMSFSFRPLLWLFWIAFGTVLLWRMHTASYEADGLHCSSASLSVVGHRFVLSHCAAAIRRA